MPFQLPHYHAPDFGREPFTSAADVATARVTRDGVAPEGYHATSIYPEYFKINGHWRLVAESRMDCPVVVKADGALSVIEFRRLRAGDQVILGRTEDGRDGIYLHGNPFAGGEATDDQVFAFRTGRSRETTYSMDYDHLYELLRYERNHGHIVWVLGPAVVFDQDARQAMEQLIRQGFVHAVFAGNALAVHDLEGAVLGTALGQDVYTKSCRPNGHYHHIDIINRVKMAGSIADYIDQERINAGVVAACVRHHIPLLLAGSIRDDGPLPGVIADVYAAQDAMRAITRKATTVICLATMLHMIATGNMTPMYQVSGETVRPVYIYAVDVSEFAVNKLRDRGSLEVASIVTNVQDFVVQVARSVSEA